MKVRSGGGGVDKDGNAYTLPEQEIEVPDDYFKALLLDMSKWEPPEFIVVDPRVFEHLKKAQS
jgi:hypothetical protein